jgi:hypothetical protein
LGYYENFPANIHRLQKYNPTVSIKQLQQRLIRIFYEINRRNFSFEEITNPTLPGGIVFFEFGLAESEGFNFIDEEELKRAMDFLSKERVSSLDFFCSIRYYKSNGEARQALKFDYYMLRAVFSKEALELLVFHERGPRYISPEELTDFIFIKINEFSTGNKKILKKTSS